MSEQADDVRSTNDGLGLPARVVVGWGGQVTAVWFRSDAGLAGGRLFTSVRGAGGVWSDPVAVSPTFAWGSGERMDVAAGRGGAVSVVWTAPIEGAMRVFEVHRDGPSWSAPLMLGKGQVARVAMDGRNQTTVMWVQRRVHVVTRTPEGVWSAPRVFSGTVELTWAHDLAVNRAGDVVLLWSRQGTYHVRTMASFRPRTSLVWPQAVTVPVKLFGARRVGLDVDRSGRVLAAGAGGSHVWWTKRSRAGRWSPAQKIAGNVGEIGEYGDLALSLNRYGSGLAHWTTEGFTYGARYRPDRGFGAPAYFGFSAGQYSLLSPLLAADGTGVVAGSRGSGPVAYRWQAPGRPWSAVQQLDTPEAVNAVGARGARIVILFQQQGLRVRVINVP